MPVLEYKCKSCGGGMTFDATTGLLTCPYCDRQDNIDELKDPLVTSTFNDNEAKEYHCRSCAAVIITEAETSATTCSFCGSAVVLADKLSGKLAPVKLIPFIISKEQAIAAFRKWCRNGLLVPNDFKIVERVNSMIGIYVPFWLYDLDSDIYVSGKATRIRMYTKGDYRYTETKHYQIARDLQAGYAKVPVDAAEKMDDALMDRLEPFSYEQLKSFKTQYLAGYIAEKYKYDDAELLPRVKNKVAPYIDSYIRSTTTGYTTVALDHKNISTKPTRADYVLLPVWSVLYRYKNVDYTFAMNGQTGKVVGRPPISKWKVSAWFSGIAATSWITMKVIGFFMGGGA